MSDAQRIVMALESIGLPAPQVGEPNDSAMAKLAESVDKLIAVAKAAYWYREKVEYTGGDSTEHFRAEQDALDAALAPLKQAAFKAVWGNP